MKKIKLISSVLSLIVIAGVYSFTVNINTLQAAAKKYKIGDIGPAGGTVFYDKGNASGGWQYLEAAPDELGQAEWGCDSIFITTGGIAVGTGKANTEAILKKCDEPGIAARKCSEYRGGGKSDWFLPSKDELNLMCENLKIAGRTTFSANLYWSSTDVNDNGYTSAWGQCFNTGKIGFQSPALKASKFHHVRAIRAF